MKRRARRGSGDGRPVGERPLIGAANGGSYIAVLERWLGDDGNRDDDRGRCRDGDDGRRSAAVSEAGACRRVGGGVGRGRAVMAMMARRRLTDLPGRDCAAMDGTRMEARRFNERRGKPEAPEGERGSKPDWTSHVSKKCQDCANFQSCLGKCRFCRF